MSLPATRSTLNRSSLALAGVQVAAGLMSGFPVSSSGSRTALAIAARAHTQLYSLVAATVVILVLFVAGPLIENLPQAALAAVVFYAATMLVSWKEFVRLARFRTTELVLAVTATLGTVLFGVLVGVGLAIALSLVEILYRLARPHEGVLGRVPGLAGMHDVDDYPDAETLPGLVVYRYDAPLFFANVGDMRRRAMLAVDQENASPPSTRCVGSSSTSRPTSKSTSPPPTDCAISTTTSPPSVSASPWRGSNVTCGRRSNGLGWPT